MFIASTDIDRPSTSALHRANDKVGRSYHSEGKTCVWLSNTLAFLYGFFVRMRLLNFVETSVHYNHNITFNLDFSPIFHTYCCHILFSFLFPHYQTEIMLDDLGISSDLKVSKMTKFLEELIDRHPETLEAIESVRMSRLGRAYSSCLGSSQPLTPQSR